MLEPIFILETPLKLAFDLNKIHFFDPESELRLTVENPITDRVVQKVAESSEEVE